MSSTWLWWKHTCKGIVWLVRAKLVDLSFGQWKTLRRPLPQKRPGRGTSSSWSVSDLRPTPTLQGVFKKEQRRYQLSEHFHQNTCLNTHVSLLQMCWGTGQLIIQPNDLLYIRQVVVHPETCRLRPRLSHHACLTQTQVEVCRAGRMYIIQRDFFYLVTLWFKNNGWDWPPILIIFFVWCNQRHPCSIRCVDCPTIFGAIFQVSIYLQNTLQGRSAFSPRFRFLTPSCRVACDWAQPLQEPTIRRYREPSEWSKPGRLLAPNHTRGYWVKTLGALFKTKKRNCLSPEST